MTNTERFVNCALGKAVDRGVFWEDRLWNETRIRWIGEGMPEIFTEFVLERYFSVIETAKNCGVQVIDVDSDGQIAVWANAPYPMCFL